MATEVIANFEVISSTVVVDAIDGAYAAGDVVSNSNSGTTQPVTFDFDNIVVHPGRAGQIRGALIISESEAITPILRLYLFTVNESTLTTHIRDNVAAVCPNHADLAYLIGVIDFEAMRADGDDSWAPDAMTKPLPFRCASGSSSIYGILVTKSAFTQTAGDDMTIKLFTERW